MNTPPTANLLKAGKVYRGSDFGCWWYIWYNDKNDKILELFDDGVWYGEKPTHTYFKQENADAKVYNYTYKLLNRFELINFYNHKRTYYHGL